jgi:hypothetical protein
VVATSRNLVTGSVLTIRRRLARSSGLLAVNSLTCRRAHFTSVLRPPRRPPDWDILSHQFLPVLAHIIPSHFLDAGGLESLPWNEPAIEVRNVFALIENAAGNAILNLRSERPRLVQIAWVVTGGICIEVPGQQIFVRREVIVCRTRLEHLDEGKTPVLNGGLENASHQFNVAAKATSNEGGVEREDQVHARQRMLGDPVGARIHWLALRCERTRLPSG